MLNDAKPQEIYINSYDKSMRHCGNVEPPKGCSIGSMNIEELRGSTPSRDGTRNGNERGFLHPPNHLDLTRCFGMRRSKLHNSPLGKRRKTSR